MVDGSVQNRVGCCTLKRYPTGQHLVQNHPQSIEVGTIVHRPALGLLRRHVFRGAHHHTGAGQAGALSGTGNAKIGDLGRSIGREQDIGRFDIPVDHTSGKGPAARR